MWYSTLSKVVMASVAMLRFTSVIKFSRSRLQLVTDAGWIMATLFKVRTAANLKVGLGELRNNCKTRKRCLFFKKVQANFVVGFLHVYTVG